jgi:hypothetical protein
MDSFLELDHVPDYNTLVEHCSKVEVKFNNLTSVSTFAG